MQPRLDDDRSELCGQRKLDILPCDEKFSVKRRTQVLLPDSRMTKRNSRHGGSRRTKRSERERLSWLVNFGALTPHEISMMHDTELERLRFEVWSFRVLNLTHGDLETLSKDRIGELARRIGSGLRALMRGEAWRPRLDSITLHLDWNGKRAHTGYVADHLDGFLLEAFDLFASQWRRLRRCQRSECRRIFAANKRQAFCSASCSQLERTKRFLQRHTREELSERRHKRYVEQVRRTKGPTRQVGRRAVVGS